MKMLFHFQTLFILLMICLAFENAPGTNAPVTMAGSVSCCANSVFTVPVTVSGFNQITAVSLRLDFDPAFMTFTSYGNLNPLLAGCLVNIVPESASVMKILIVWSDMVPVTLPDGSILADLSFTSLSGSAALSYNNTENSGGDCEYADQNGDPMNDMPTNLFYTDAAITVHEKPPDPVIHESNAILYSNASDGNQWFRNGNLINGATSDFYYAMSPEQGSYNCVVSLSGCHSEPSNTIYWIFTGTDAVREVPFTIYPDPNEGSFDLTFSPARPGQFNIAVYDASGRKVYFLADFPASGIVKMRIDLEKPEDGIYTIRFENGAESSATRFVIRK